MLDGYSGPRSADIASLYATTATGVFAFIAASAVLRDRSPHPVLAALLLSAGLASGIVFAQSVGAVGLFGELVGPSSAADRMTGPFGDPNYAGAYYASASVLAVACAVVARSPWLKLAILGLASLVVAALVLTESRGGLVALAAGLTTIAVTRGRRALLITATAILVLVATAYPVFVDMRFGSDSDIAGRGLSAQLDEADRIEPWLAGGDVFLSAPLFGVGWGRMVEESSIGIKAHNWYVAVLAETGITGFVLWALFILSVVIALRRSPPPARTLGYSVLVVWMTASMFIEVPQAYGATGPVLIVIAAALWADWTHSGGDRSATMSDHPAHPARWRPSHGRVQSG
jgi:O-antigen ligase